MKHNQDTSLFALRRKKKTYKLLRKKELHQERSLNKMLRMKRESM